MEENQVVQEDTSTSPEEGTTDQTDPTVTQTPEAVATTEEMNEFKSLIMTDHGPIEILHSMTLGDITVTVSLSLVLIFMVTKWFISLVWR